MNITTKLDKYLDEIKITEQVDNIPLDTDDDEYGELFDSMADFILDLDEEQLTEEQQDIFGEILEELGYDEDDEDDEDDLDEDLDEDELYELRMAKRTSAGSRRKSKQYYRKNKSKIKRKKKKFKKSAAGKRRAVKGKRMAKQNKTATGKRRVKYH